MHKTLFAIALCTGLIGMASDKSQAEEPQPGKQVAQKSDAGNGKAIHYWLSLPKDYSDQKKAPLMIFLHGMGERGNDLDQVLKHGPPKLIKAGKEFPFIVVSPQLTTDVRRWDVQQLSTMLDDLESNYAIDKSRIYLTGLSMGGYGTWAWGAETPERFAALAPICGGGDPDKANQLTKVPIWAFHGMKDNAVPVERSIEMKEAIEAAGGDIKLTLYPEASHDSWTESYNNPELYQWFLSHKRE
ncbi:prolyl oligopeptidase family serine peptidase [uncultured Rubinisphaera sp.]|uniref:carboxylesterase family protein n=1 Tax=uncultured Rubinisphaera sp. TaxID=1678686 RepID=UPI0030DAE659